MEMFSVKVILISRERARDWQKEIYFDKSEFYFQFETGEVWVGQGMKGGIIHDSDLVSHSHQNCSAGPISWRKKEKN